MHRRLILSVFFAAAMAAGCSSTSSVEDGAQVQSPTPVAQKAETPAAQAAAVKRSRKKDPNELHCTRYKPTGSHRSVTRCVTQAQRTAERDSAVLTLQRTMAGSASGGNDVPVGGAGGNNP